MARYIDADKLIEVIEDKMFDSPLMHPVMKMMDLMELIEEQPSADVVEVVRCKDCACFDRQRFSGDKGYCKRFRGGRNEMNYCDFGYREEVE